MLFGRPSPQDHTRYPAGYAGGLTPTVMGNLFDAADAGEIGPLNELCDEIRGKDPLVKGLSGDRLSTVADSNLWIEPNPADPSAARQGELCIALEQLFQEIKLYRYEQHGKERCPVEAGELPEVQELFALPWYQGLGIYFVVWATAQGEPRPKPVGIEYIDPRRYRTSQLGAQSGDDALYLESAKSWMGEPLWEINPLLWFSLSANQAGLRSALAGVGRSLVFWWWMRINGAFALSRLLEKFGVPNVIGEMADPMGQGFADSKGDLEKFLASYQSDVSALFPKGFKAIVLNVPPGSDGVAAAVDRVTGSAIRYGITGNEVTGAASAPGQAGVAGGAPTVGERIQARLYAQDKRRSVLGLRHVARRYVTVWHGATCPVPTIKLLDPSVAAPTSGTNTAPTQTTQGAQ